MIEKTHLNASHRRKLIDLFLILSILLLAGCGADKEKEIPGMHIAGIRTTISRILISPLAFDSAIVAVEGLAQDVKKQTENGEEGYKTLFKLSDLRGNFLNVSVSGNWEIFEKDHLIVGGIYRRTTNEIEAEQVEKIQIEEEQ
jgi:hypothetical protein